MPSFYRVVAWAATENSPPRGAVLACAAGLPVEGQAGILGTRLAVFQGADGVLPRRRAAPTRSGGAAVPVGPLAARDGPFADARLRVDAGQSAQAVGQPFVRRRRRAARRRLGPAAIGTGPHRAGPPPDARR